MNKKDQIVVLKKEIASLKEKLESFQPEKLPGEKQFLKIVKKTLKKNGGLPINHKIFKSEIAKKLKISIEKSSILINKHYAGRWMILNGKHSFCYIEKK